MSVRRITVNGRHYGSPEEMPPDVRRQYEEAMRRMGAALADGKASDTTQVITGPVGSSGQGSIVVRQTVVVNQAKHGSPGEVPPEVRRLLERARQAPGTAGASVATMNVTVEAGGPKLRRGDSGRPAAPLGELPLVPSDVQSKARDLVWNLAFWVAVALAVGFWLAR